MLSNRLKAIIDNVDSNVRVADIGTDHGLVPATLFLQGKIHSAVLTDINAKPLERAKKYLTERSLLDHAIFRVGDGLVPIQTGEVDQVIIAGMGGEMIAQILREDLAKAKSFDKLILQPMTRSEELRKFLSENGFTIEREIVIKEASTRKDRFFTILVVRPGETTTLSEMEQLYGAREAIEVNQDYLDYLVYEHDKLTERLSRMQNSQNSLTQMRCHEFKQRCLYLEEYYESLQNYTVT